MRDNGSSNCVRSIQTIFMALKEIAFNSVCDLWGFYKDRREPASAQRHCERGSERAAWTRFRKTLTRGRGWQLRPLEAKGLKRLFHKFNKMVLVVFRWWNYQPSHLMPDTLTYRNNYQCVFKSGTKLSCGWRGFEPKSKDRGAQHGAQGPKEGASLSLQREAPRGRGQI